jgi:hypothetical protein
LISNGLQMEIVKCLAELKISDSYWLQSQPSLRLLLRVVQMRPSLFRMMVATVELAHSRP